MADDTDLAAAVRRLTKAVWCLSALVVGVLAVLLWPSMRTQLLRGAVVADRATGSMLSGLDEDNDFHTRPIEERVERATAILVTRRESRGTKHKAVISEVLKKAPGVQLYYKVGDEYAPFGHAPTPECDDCDGEGDVVFFTGNPAMMRESLSYRNDRILGLGDMPLSELRRLAANPG